jgi:uncharacterized protein YprB with RNaseH-like and TPR domain
MISELKGKSILIYDIETNGLDALTAECKWFIAYSYKNDKHYCMPYTCMKAIKKLLKGHNKLIGFNNKGFDNEILKNQHEVDFKYKNIIDLVTLCPLETPLGRM